METKSISIKQILDDLLDHPLLQDLTLERVINYTIEFIRIVGMPNLFQEKVQEIQVQDYRAQLPCDFYKMIQVQMNEKNSHEFFRYSTDTMHFELIDKHFPALTYKIQGDVIFTSQKNCNIKISYQALMVDGEGYPCIPDNSPFIIALEAYIKKKRFGILFDQSKIQPAVFSNAQQEYAWAVGQCQSALIRPTIDQMESITNMWNTFIPRVNEHNRGFIGNGSKEYIKLQ